LDYITGWSGGAVAAARVREIVGRAGDIRWFVEQLNEEEPRTRILEIVAPSGHGKSWFLSALLHDYTLRLREPDDLAYLQSCNDEMFAANASKHAAADALPAAYVDLETASDPVRAFLALRGQLHGLDMPRFDFVVFLLLRRTRALDLVALRDYFAPEAAGFVTSVVEAAFTISDAVPPVPALLKILSKYYKEDAHEFLRRRNVDKQLLALVQHASNQDLLDLLPQVFASDLGEADCGRPVVLFFDGVDSLQPPAAASTHELFRRDEWLRLFLRSLAPSPATLAVLATSRKVRWSDAPAFPFPDGRLETRELRGLSGRDAEELLIGRGIDDPAERAAMLELSRAGADEHSPLLLYLQTLHAPAARDAPADLSLDPAAVVFARFTKRLAGNDDSEAFVALCAMRSFGYDEYERAAELVAADTGAPLFTPSRAQFDRLVSLGIVNRQADRRWRVVFLARKLAHLCYGDLAGRCHSAFADWYRRAGDDVSAAEEVYHRAFVDAEAGTRRWLALFWRAYDQGRIAACEALLDVVREMPLPPAAVPMLLCAEGAYLWTIGRIEAAHAAFSRGVEAASRLLAADPAAAMPLLWIVMNLNGLADLERDTVGPEPALSRYRSARQYAARLPPEEHGRMVTLIAIAEAGLLAATGKHESGLQILSDVAAQLSPMQSAASIRRLRFERAPILEELGAYDEARALYEEQATDPAWNEPAAHGLYGDLLAALGDRGRADELTSAAHAGFEKRLEGTPGDLGTLLNSAHASLQRSRLALAAGDPARAKAHAALALDRCDAALAVTPDALALHLRRGEAALDAALASLAAGMFDEAIDLVSAAESSLQHTLEGAPMTIAALDGFGRAAGIRGKIELQRGRIADAWRALSEAEERYARAAEAYPTSVPLAINRTAYLFEAVRLHIFTGSFEEAKATAEQMMRIAEFAAGNVQLLLNGGNAWVALAVANGSLGDLGAASDAVERAVERLRAAQRIAPGHRLVLCSRSSALATRADILRAAGRPVDADESSRLAVQVAEPLVAPLGNASEILTVVDVYRARAEAALGVSAVADAREYVRKARALLTQFATRFPDERAMASFLMQLAHLAARIARRQKDARETLEEAREGLRLARQLLGEHPAYEWAERCERGALALIGETLLETRDFAGAVQVFAELAGSLEESPEDLNDYARSRYFEAGARAAIGDPEAVPRFVQARDAFGNLIASGRADSDSHRLHQLSTRGAAGDLAPFRVLPPRG
jgi:tetratricopeptide (TPR) repeat protein